MTPELQKLIWEHDYLVAENERLRVVIRDLLLSADAEWEQRREGHDWAEACAEARAALAAAATDEQEG